MKKVISLLLALFIILMLAPTIESEIETQNDNDEETPAGNLVILVIGGILAIIVACKLFASNTISQLTQWFKGLL